MKRKESYDEEFNTLSQISIPQSENQPREFYELSSILEENEIPFIDICSEKDTLQDDVFNNDFEWRSWPEASNRDLMSLVEQIKDFNVSSIHEFKNGTSTVHKNMNPKVQNQQENYKKIQRKVNTHNPVEAKLFWFICKASIKNNEYISATWGHKLHKSCLKLHVLERIQNLRTKVKLSSILKLD